MQPSRVTVVIPTLSADFTLWECVASLQNQTYRDFCIVIVDNSGRRKTELQWPGGIPRENVTVLHPEGNIGFGAAVNLAARERPAEFIGVINDDAVAEPGWIGALVTALENQRQAGSAAAQVRLQGLPDVLDSAGMLIAADGSSKQRGHGEPAARYPEAEEVILASGSAAMYRSKMLAETGGFDDSYFLYCEDTDLGLRARWAGWTCWYVPDAIVHHRYSHSAGRASRLKAYYVERNRLLTIGKNFPPGRLIAAFLATPVRYFHHLLAMRRGQGATAQFRQSGESAWTLVGCVLQAYAAAAARIPEVWRQRQAIRHNARLKAGDFGAALDRYSISLRKVAEL